MNARIAQIFTGITLLFAALVGFLTWWQIISAPQLREKNYNRQTAYYQERIKRGDIVAGGKRLVTSKRFTAGNGDTLYRRAYPAGGLAAQLIGYSTQGRSRSGVEKQFGNYLSSSHRDLALNSFVEKLQGNETVVGARLVLTLDPQAQKVAEQQLQGHKGAIVALEPRTGRVVVAASAPTFDPGRISEKDYFSKLNKRTDAPLLNRATQAGYAPGSIFKVITAAAALENDVTDLGATFPGGCTAKTAGPDISNFGGACFGSHDLTTALTKSINVTFARLGMEVGSADMREQMRKFGFESTPPLDDIPIDERTASGLYDGSRLLEDDTPIDVARLAIGQERLRVTPLQMAMVGATIANGGELMQPYVVERVIEPDGRVVRQTEPESLDQAISAETAADLTEMMRSVVKEGTGVAGALQGIDVAGKTGTADTAQGNQVWFLAFAPADNPQVAMVVTVEAQPEGQTGGVVAAPMARAVMQELLQGAR